MERVLGEQVAQPHHEPIEDGGVFTQPQLGARELAPGEDRRVVPGEDRGIEQLQPVATVGGVRDGIALGGAAAGEERIVGERSAAQQRLGDAVREERVCTRSVDLGEQCRDDVVDRRTADGADTPGGQMGQRVEQVGPHVGIDEVAGEGARNPPLGEVRGGE